MRTFPSRVSISNFTNESAIWWSWNSCWLEQIAYTNRYFCCWFRSLIRGNSTPYAGISNSNTAPARPLADGLLVRRVETAGRRYRVKWGHSILAPDPVARAFSNPSCQTISAFLYLHISKTMSSPSSNAFTLTIVSQNDKNMNEKVGRNIRVKDEKSRRLVFSHHTAVGSINHIKHCWFSVTPNIGIRQRSLPQ